MARRTSVQKKLETTIDRFKGISGDISTPVFSAPFEQSLAYDGFGVLYYERLSEASYVDRTTRQLTFAKIDQARFEEDGMLIESDGKNYCKFSTDFTNAAWTKNDVVVESTNNLDPTGSSNASMIKTTSLSSYKKLTYQRTFTDAGRNTVSFSIFVKKPTGGTGVDSFDLFVRNNGLTPSPAVRAKFTFDADGYISKSAVVTEFQTNEVDVVDADIQKLEDGWSRVSISPKFITSFETTHMIECSIHLSYNSNTPNDNGKKLLVYGAQIERNWYSTSYIRTSNNEGIRTGDVLRVQTDRNIPHISYDHTISLDVKLRGPNRTGNQRIFWTSSLDGIEANREKYRLIEWRYDVNAGQGGYVVYAGNQTAQILPPFVDIKAKTRMGFRKNQGSTVVFADGLVLSRNSDANYGTGSRDWMWFGSDQFTNNHFDGYISNVRIYDKALSDDEILMV